MSKRTFSWILFNINTFSEERITSLQGTKQLAPKCALFGGNYIHYIHRDKSLPKTSSSVLVHISPASPALQGPDSSLWGSGGSNFCTPCSLGWCFGFGCACGPGGSWFDPVTLRRASSAAPLQKGPRTWMNWYGGTLEECVCLYKVESLFSLEPNVWEKRQ